MQPALLLANALVISTLVVGPKRARAACAAALIVLVAVLVASSTPRLVGDAQEYIAMSANLSHGGWPSLTPAELQRATTLVPDGSMRFEHPELYSAGGRQDFSHFWFYSLLAAPFLIVALAVGAHPVVAFTALNIALLAVAVWVMQSKLSPAAVLLLAAGPIVWWIDKAHTEVFTFALLSIAIVLVTSAPWWSIVVLGAAATQNPPIALAMLAVVVYAMATVGPRDARLWAATAAGGVLAALHPLYYHARLGLWSSLQYGVDRHWPSSRELTTALFDPNVGIFVHDPFIVVAAVGALAVCLRRAPHLLFSRENGLVAIIGVLFIFSFSQTVNFNARGTPGPSRYGLWLLPLAIPLLEAVPASSVWLRLVAALSVVWCSAQFAPAQPEQYLKPTSLAATIWQRWPGLDDPLAEVFSERVSGREPSPDPPLATFGCEKVLLMGTGTTANWPAGCMPSTVPLLCRDRRVICYANKDAVSYSFSRAPATPAWLTAHAGSADAPPPPAEATPVTNFTLPADKEPAAVLWLGDGWSYPEQAPDADAHDGVVRWRWMGERAQLGVLPPDAERGRLILVASAFRGERRLRVSVGGSEVATLIIGAGRRTYATPLFQLGAGPSIIQLDSLDGADAPGGSDRRRLSVQLFHAEFMTGR